ncbi:hypothetical protein I4P06_09455 [Enterobacter asburiae]|uniref:hypothetical protein n=1 Tax=Enterobacter asburiae TaxID=61645 RepID=UPI0018C20747|nr:hypothetical protein [Enterobacter asburiae]MBG0638235.1 hypothetical protein [Enterobacter asburiae]MDS1913649.1 hypothetical protein [Enterobacter asburiae]
MKKDNAEANNPKKKKTCFIIMPIADHIDYEPGHFDRVYNHLIKPACIDAGYEPIRADDSKASNMIMLDVLRSIIDCDMAICDLSSRNANVFYELGLRQAFDKKTILIRDGRHDVPFDLLGFRYVNYTPSLRVDTVKKEMMDISEMLLKTDEAHISDANSIVSILKMKPAEIDTRNLNAEESLMFELLNRMKRLEGSINEFGSNNAPAQGGITWRNTSSHKTSLDLNKSNFIHSNINFNEALNLFSEDINNIHFFYENEIIGKFTGVTKGSHLIFQKGTRQTSIKDTEEERAKIFVA